MGWVLGGQIASILDQSDNCGANGVLLVRIILWDIFRHKSPLSTIVGDNGGLFGGFLRHFCGQNANGGDRGYLHRILCELQMGYTGVAKSVRFCVKMEVFCGPKCKWGEWGAF